MRNPIGRKLVQTCAAILAAMLVFAVLWLQGSSKAQSFAVEHGYLPLVARRWPAPTPTPSPGRLVISEVVVNPPGSEPDGEWIEIYNAGDLSITLNRCKIGDAALAGENEGMYSLPDGLTLQGGETRVIANFAPAFRNRYPFNPDYEINNSNKQVPDLVRYRAWAEGPFSLTNGGDEVILLDAKDQMVDGVGWGSSLDVFYPAVNAGQEGESLERYPPNQDTNTAQDWRRQPVPNPRSAVIPPPTPTPSPTLTATPTPTVTPTRTPTPAVVINEIHADPHASQGDANGDGVVSIIQDEFIEIVNITGAAADMSGWQLVNTSGVRHTIPEGTIIPDHCSLVIFGGGIPAGSFGSGTVQVASSGSLELFNVGDTVLLLDPYGSPMTTATYGPEAEDNQSITRNPDLTGTGWVKHSLLAEAGERLFSPGTRVDGAGFGGCPAR